MPAAIETTVSAPLVPRWHQMRGRLGLENTTDRCFHALDDFTSSNILTGPGFAREHFRSSVCLLLVIDVGHLSPRKKLFEHERHNTRCRDACHVLTRSW